MAGRSDILPLPERIETERLALRPCRADDVPGFQRFMADADATRHMLFTDDQKTPEGARAMLDNVIASYATEAPLFVLAAADRVGDGFVGACGLNPQGGGRAEVFFALLPEHHGRGLGAEMVGALVAYAFQVLGLDALGAATALENARSLAILEGLGFAAVGPPDGLGTGWQVFELKRKDFAA